MDRCDPVRVGNQRPGVNRPGARDVNRTDFSKFPVISGSLPGLRQQVPHPRSTASPLRKGCQVAQTTEEHRSHPGKQQRADLETAKVIRTAKTDDDCDRAENYTDDPAKSTHPEQQLIHR
jgi:hypothetical protein